MTLRAILPISLGSLLVLSGCQAVEPEPTTEPVEVSVEGETESTPDHTIVVTTTVLGSVVSDIANCVADGSIAVETLMPIGTDPHDFQASSEQLASIANAGIVVANGLQLEEGLDDPLEQLEADGGTVLRVAEWVDPLPFAEKDEHDDHGHGADEDSDAASDDHGHGEFDPHFWLDMSRVAAVAERLGSELGPELGSDFADCAVQVSQDIGQVETEVIDTLSVIPDDKKVLVTDHDAFGYFAERYGFRVAGVVIPGGSTLAEPSSQELAELVGTIRSEGVSAIFGSYFVPSDLMAAVAEESGGDISVVPLYVGSIGEPGSEAADYSSMMLTNARLIASALQD